MLLATYAIATLTIEQKCERSAIRRLQEPIERARASQQFDFSALAIQSERLIRLAESLHWRRLENCLIPALREASSDALIPLPGAGQRHIASACGTINSYCQNLLARLAFEEQQLLPLAQRLLATDAWFKVGTAFLLQDAQS